MQFGQTNITNLESVKVEVEVKVRVDETNGKNIKHEVQDWLRGAHEILEKFDAEIKGKLDNQESNSCFCGSSCEVGKMLDDIKKLLKQSGEFESISYPGDPPPIGSMYHTNNKSLPSRTKISEKILEALKDGSNSIITMYGIPGSGKTTLLKETLMRVEADELFKVITEVINVSETPDIKMIQDSIATRIQLNLFEQGDEGNRSFLLHHQLKSRLLEGKRILVVFDDICTEIEDILVRVGIPFSRKGKPSCTILFSTRKLDVRKKIDEDNHFRLGCLDLVEAKHLFQHGLGSQIPNDMSEIYTPVENQVLQKCKGLPSAITELADILKCSWPNCVDFVYNLNCNSRAADEIVRRSHQSIERNYNMLKCDRKKFFLLSCLFLQGTNISVQDLMRYGFGLSLFGEIRTLDEITRRAKAWVDDIKALSLFENKDAQGCVNIHNIIQEFAMSTASEEKYLLLLDNGPSWKSTQDYKKYTIICMSAKSDVESNHDTKELNGLKNSIELPELKALFLKGKSSNCEYSCFVPKMEKLHVLGFTKMKLSTVPSFIKQLQHLVTLNVEYCDIEDASFISILRSLTILSFRGSKIKNFLGDEQLDYLRLLDLTECCFGEVIGDVVANPSHLEGLYMCGSFGVDNIEVVTVSLVHRLRSLVHLYALEIEIPSTCLRNVGDLLLGKKIQRFKIAIGCKFPSSFKEYYFFNQVLMFEDLDLEMLNKDPFRNLLEKTEALRLVNIGNLKKFVYDMGLHFLQLKYLHISRCNQMKCIVNTVGMAADPKILLALEILILEQLHNLEKICYWQTPQKWCSKLRELKLSNLRELKPHVLPNDYDCKLAVVEIRDCESLQHIFSSIATPEISVSGEVYVFPDFKMLKLQSLPMLKSLWAGETTTSDQIYQPLFHEKINLPALEELNLSNLDNIKELWESSPSNPSFAKTTFSNLRILILDEMAGIKHVWSKELCKGSLSFSSLKKIAIIHCAHLESVCPPTIPAALVELQCMEITSCGDLKEVIMTETNAKEAVKFSSLEMLKLENLPSLQYFFHGSYTIEFPSLKKLLLYSLPNMSTFGEEISSQGGINSIAEKMPLICREIEFPSLEHLELCDMENIEKLVEEGRAAFPELKTLTIKNIGLKFIPGNILGKLEQLEVRNCASLQGLPWTSLQKLSSLVIHGNGSLLGMKSVLSTTDIVQGKGLPQLKYINIEECDHLEEIVSNECNLGVDDLLKDGIPMFPQLNHIKLHKLARFKTFSSGTYEATFPALEEVEINECPNFEKFYLGTLRTPRLRFVKVNEDSRSEMDRDLKYFLQSENKGFEKGKELQTNNAERTLEKVKRPINGMKESRRL